jgi:hypothetical protein
MSVTTMSVSELKVDLKIKKYFSCSRKFGHSIFFPFTYRMNKSYEEVVFVSNKLIPPVPTSQDEELHLMNLMFEVQFQENFVFVRISSRTVDPFEYRPTFDLNAQIHMPRVETLRYKDNCSRVQLKMHRSWFEYFIMAYITSEGTVSLPVHFQIINFLPKNSVSLEEYEALLTNKVDEKYDWKLKEQACSVFLLRPPGQPSNKIIHSRLAQQAGQSSRQSSKKEEHKTTNVTLTMLPSSAAIVRPLSSFHKISKDNETNNDLITIE